MPKLTDKQKMFVAEYLIDLNATQAAIRAGYSRKTAKSIGPELLGKTWIAQAIQQAKETRTDRLELEQDKTVREWERLAYSDIRRLFNAQGQLLSIHDLDDDVAAAVSSVKVVTKTSGRDVADIEYIHEIKLWDKNTALRNLGQHQGLLKEHIVHEVIDKASIAKEFRRIVEAAKARKS